jgi:hypothetical protein
VKRAAVVGLAFLSGCVVLPIFGGPPPVGESNKPSLVVRDGVGSFETVRGLVHCHSKLSHDCKGEFEDIAAAANEDRVAFVILCDHLKGIGAEDGPDGEIDGVLFIPGAEINSDGGGSLLSLGARKGVITHGTDAQVIASIRSQGGLVGIAHPEEEIVAGVDDPDGVELMNLHADVNDENKFSLFWRALFFPPKCFFRSIIDRQAQAAVVYDAYARKHALAALGSCDAHEAIRPLGPLAGAIDSYRRVFRAAATHVLLPSREKLSKKLVIDALRAGRSYAACEIDRDASDFRFEAWKDGNVVARLGDWAELGVELEAEAPSGTCTLTLLRDGAPVARAENATELKYAPTLAGAYRVEATLDGKPWVATSAIRVRDVAPVGSRVR